MSDRSWEAARVLYEIGLQVQMAALMMRRHRVDGPHQLCECGRTPACDLPGFGRRCDVAGDHWDRAHEAMRTFLRSAERPARAVGRVAVVRDGRLL